MRGTPSSKSLAIAGTLLTLVMARSAAQAQDCTSDDECEPGSACEVTASSSTGCAPGGPDAGACETETVEYRECRPKPIACKVDSDCPTDLQCVTDHAHGDDSSACVSAPDAGADCPAEQKPQPSAPQCEFLWTHCETDDDCDEGHYCLAADETSCAAAAECPPGAKSCPPICTTSTKRRVCFPKRVDCTSDAECEKGWQCFDLSKDQQAAAPPGWEDASRVCFPDGLALAVGGKVEIGNRISDDSSASADDKGGADELSSGGAAKRDGGVDTAESTSKTKPMTSDDGCAVSDVASDRGSVLAILLAALAAVFVRRRVRSRA